MSASATLTLNEGNYDPNQSVQWIDDGDKGLHVEFYKHPVDGEDHVRIIIPGDTTTQPDYLATEHYKMRFKRQWAIYKGQLEEFSGQERIETVAWIDPGLVNDMKRADIHTIEQLANMSDASIDSTNMIGLMSFRERAKEHLAEKAKSSQYDTLQAQNAELMKRLEKLEGRRGNKPMTEFRKDGPAGRTAGQNREALGPSRCFASSLAADRCHSFAVPLRRLRLIRS